MAPLRRYLRITKHSVLEVRIYLDRPADAEAWLLRRNNPALPRVIQAVRPLILPKLREENERVKGRGARARKKGVKDVVVEGEFGYTKCFLYHLILLIADVSVDDFEVSIFLTELSSRHSVLTKQKVFKDKPRIQSNSGKLTSWLTAGTNEQPVVIAEDNQEPIILEEEDDDVAVNLDDIPEVGGGCDGDTIRNSSRNKRRRRSAMEEAVSDSSDSDDSFRFELAPLTKRSKRGERTLDAADLRKDGPEQQDEKKTLGLNTSYDGFNIYGRILCLVVKRKASRASAATSGVPSSQQMLENWVSTQAAAGQVDDDD
ncbi:uncharacterized protein BDR25DRAFT_252639, partial [Lindgomyces ingoldianus]